MRKIINKQRAPKDTILNNIMLEIDEENGVVVDVPKEVVLPKKKKVKKRPWLGTFLKIIMTLTTLLILYVLYIIIFATQKEEVKTSENTHGQKAIIVPIKVAKPSKIPTHTIAPVKKKIKKSEPTKKEVKQPVNNSETHSNEDKEALVRKEAKAALMKQMKTK